MIDSTITDWLLRRQAAREQISAEFFASGESVPDIDFMPPCPICDGDLFTDDGTFFDCEVCMVRWPRNGYGHEAQRIDRDGNPIEENINA